MDCSVVYHLCTHYQPDQRWQLRRKKKIQTHEEVHVHYSQGQVTHDVTKRFNSEVARLCYICTWAFKEVLSVLLLCAPTVYM